MLTRDLDDSILCHERVLSFLLILDLQFEGEYVDVVVDRVRFDLEEESYAFEIVHSFLVFLLQVSQHFSVHCLNVEVLPLFRG